MRGLVDPVSNLPNLNALRANRDGRKQALIAARVLNYDEIVATLPPRRRTTARRTDRFPTLGRSARTALFTRAMEASSPGSRTPQKPFGNHLEALYALFRNPARVSATFPSTSPSPSASRSAAAGSLANRLASALVAAEEAAHDGLKWKYHDPDTLEDASWKLSMLSQLDEAIDHGEVWVAYQPKLELCDAPNRRRRGAGALDAPRERPDRRVGVRCRGRTARPHRQADRLRSREGGRGGRADQQARREFDIAVNLSARLLTDKGFTLRVSALLARHGLAPSRLTLELTETAALAGSGEGLEMITSLRELGVNISIDDYGTGLSTLDYLKKIPANEIKIDQSFVKGIVDNRSDRLMVQSTIGLAHSLGRKVVAEGVEHHDTLDVLIEIGVRHRAGLCHRPADEPRKPREADRGRPQAQRRLTLRKCTRRAAAVQFEP